MDVSSNLTDCALGSIAYTILQRSSLNEATRKTKRPVRPYTVHYLIF